MYKIVEKLQLADSIFQMKILAPNIAENRKPGQFIILQVNNDFGERIPLTIADADADAGTISIIYKAIGKSTHLLSLFNVNDELPVVLGPLGTPTHLERFGHVVCVGGGIGAAPMYPIAQALKKIGNRLDIIIGAQSKNQLILEQEMRAIADNLIICTDDGSYGQKGLVTAPLKALCESTDKPDMVVAIGPSIMMKFCCLTTKPFNVPTVVSLNTIMIDGTGMCGGCRVTVGNETKFVCVDGPEFDGHKVDFDNLLLRLGSYIPHETKEFHECKLNK